MFLLTCLTHTTFQTMTSNGSLSCTCYNNKRSFIYEYSLRTASTEAAKTVFPTSIHHRRRPLLFASPVLWVLQALWSTEAIFAFGGRHSSSFARPLHGSSSNSSQNSSQKLSPVLMSHKNKNMIENNSVNSFDDDDKLTKEFHEIAAAAVELSGAHVDKRGHLTVTRSVRDWDQETRKKYLYHFPLHGGNGSQRNNNIPMPPMLLPSEIVSRVPSPSGDKLAVIVQQSASSSSPQTVLEVWTHGQQCLSNRIILPTTTKHGKVVVGDGSGMGAIPTWSPDETLLMYAAERRPPETAPFWQTSTTHQSSAPDKQPQKGGKSILGVGTMEHWGEKHEKQSALIDLYLVNSETSRIERITNVPGDVNESTTANGVTLGQALFAPDGKSVVYTGWDAGGLGEMPRRLGFLFCRNRPSKIYASPIGKLLRRLANEGDTDDKETTTDAKKDEEEKDGMYRCITPHHRLSRSPEFVSLADGTTQLVFLSNEQGFDSHEGCMGLCRIDWDASMNTNAQKIYEVVPVVNDPSETGPKVAGMGFPGLFMGNLPRNCGVHAGSIVTSTIWGSFIKVVRINIKDGSISLVKFQVEQTRDGSVASLSSSQASYSILCTTPDGGLVISESAPNQPARILHVPSVPLVQTEDTKAKETEIVVRAQVVSALFPVAATSFSPISFAQRNVADLTCQVVTTIPPKVDGAVDTPIQSLLLLPKEKEQGEKHPLIVIPHGGPHSCSLMTYVLGPAYLCAAGGYAVLLPNYRGSIGFGQSSIQSLLSRIGDMDVKDVVAACNHITSSQSTLTTEPLNSEKKSIEDWKGRIDGTKIGICGGSHGGFLTGHCTGQYPDMFSAAAMRNPVTNIPSMVAVTDIPDWTYTEVLGRYCQQKFRGPTLDDITAMYQKSPVAVSEKVKTPTLVALGMSDLRVPPSQGLEWHYILRSKGVPTELLVYPDDCHALDSVTTEADHWIHIRRWFDKYL